MDNSVLNSSSFTCKYGGKAFQLITECKLCKAFNPSTHIGEHPELITFNALWDTGATGTVITQKVAERLGILPTGQILAFHANGKDMVNTYIVNIMLPNNVGITEVDVTEGDLSGFDMLIGMNVIQHGDFSVSCKNGNTVFSFQLPSTRELDFVNEHNREVAKANMVNRQTPPSPDKRSQARKKRKKR